MKKKSEHYVDNKKFLQAMIEYRESCSSAETNGTEKPPVTNYIGECFLKIANHLSYRPKIKESFCLLYTDNLLCFYSKNTEREKTTND